MPAKLPCFHARYPEIRPEIVEAEPRRDLSKLGADVLLQFSWPPVVHATLSKKVGYVK